MTEEVVTVLPLPTVTLRARFRDSVPGDAPFIFNSWLKSYRKSVRVDADIYYRHQHQLIESLLKRSVVIVAADPVAPEEVWGYAVIEETTEALTVHWVYVKRLFRRLGIATDLLAMARELSPMTLRHSHETPQGTRLATRFKSTFHPEASRTA